MQTLSKGLWDIVMGYYDDASSVDEYVKMCDGYDGSELFGTLRRHLPKGASLLELGSGPGNDVAVLQAEYQVTGSDLSLEFLRRCRQRFPALVFEQLDAVSLLTAARVDCIYSNKVLQHLTMPDLTQSLQRQQQLLPAQGLIAHSFWLGDKEETMHGLYFLYHERAALLALIGQYFEVIDTYDYGEFEHGDSVFVLARKR